MAKKLTMIMLCVETDESHNFPGFAGNAHRLA